jgi:hypothetical protein
VKILNVALKVFDLLSHISAKIKKSLDNLSLSRICLVKSKTFAKAGREDLIGYGEECLVRPAGGKTNYSGRPAQNGGDRPRSQVKSAKQSNSGAKGGSSSAKAANSKPKFDKNAKKTADQHQKSQKPTYKAGWAKPKAKNGGKK